MAETTNQLIIDLAKLVQWPFVIVVIAWIFKSPLSNVLTSLLRLELKGPGFAGKMEAAEQGQAAANNPSIEKLEKPSEPSLPVASPNPVVARLENEMRNELKGINLEQRAERLLRFSAEMRLRAGHEFIYNRIFGSQSLLQNS